MDNNLKNTIVLKNLPSNIAEEAIVILKPNVKLKNKDFIENSKSKSNIKEKDSKKYIISEAENVVNNYLATLEKTGKLSNKKEKKIESKYKKARAISIFLGILLLVSFMI